MLENHRTLREGIVAGLIGATAVALWFLLIDTISGQALYTPKVLGASLSSLFGPVMGESDLGHVAFYTLVHYAAFILVGIVAAWLAAQAEREPSLLFGFLILFIVFEVGFYGWTALLALPQNFGAFAWLQVLAANLIAAALMGTYIWRAHPKLHGSLAMAFDRR